MTVLVFPQVSWHSEIVPLETSHISVPHFCCMCWVLIALQLHVWSRSEYHI